MHDRSYSDDPLLYSTFVLNKSKILADLHIALSIRGVAYG